MLTLYTGPMGASKSARLIQAYRAAERAHLRPLALQLAGTVRDGESGSLRSRTGDVAPATVVETLSHARITVAAERPAALFLDELHRWQYEAPLADVLLTLRLWLDEGITLHVAALDLDLWGRRYEPAASLVYWPGAKTERLTAPCMEPGHGPDCRATHSWCISDVVDPPVGDLARVEAGEWVGGTYAALCWLAYEPRRADRLWARLEKQKEGHAA